jgi:internalin A
MTPDEAYEEALLRIRHAQETGAVELDLSGLQALNRLPPELERFGSVQSLDLSLCEQLNDLSPLAGLTSLYTLDLSGCEQLNDLSPLAGLTSLQSLNLSWCNQLRDLSPLAALTSLQTLGLSGCEQLKDLSPLADLTSLQELDLYGCGQLTGDFAPLASFTSLESLNLDSCHQLSGDLSPLAGLASLQSLNLTGCERLSGDLSPLEGLTALQSLYLYGCEQLTGDLSHLASLTSLKSLDLSECTGIRKFARLEPLLPQLQKLHLYRCRFDDLPSEICGQRPYQNVIREVRAHLADLRSGRSRDAELKIFILGNGGVGKTQLSRRLQDLDFDPKILTTHGIELSFVKTNVNLESFKGSVRLNLWDFGGQEIYHGSHTLFLHSQAIFLLVWNSEEEKTAATKTDSEHRPITYWLDYLRAVGTDNPLIVVQSQCDTPEIRADVPVNLSDWIDSSWTVEVSAKTDYGLERLKATLQDAAWACIHKRPPPPIGKGRLQVRDRLRKMLVSDQKLPSAKRKHRLIKRQTFDQLCSKIGGIDDTDALLGFLHHNGVIFYRTGLFGDQIVLDQNWALEAVYAIFDRKKILPLLRGYGRFSRADLEALIWSGYTPKEQKVFLGMMESCDICFHVRKISDDEWEYIVPELLPEWAIAQEQLLGRLREEPPISECSARYAFLHDGILRNYLSKLSEHARDAAIYWKYGCWFYEQTSQVLIESIWDAETHVGAGTIRLRAWGQTANNLVATLLQKLRSLSTGQAPEISGFMRPRPHAFSTSSGSIEASVMRVLDVGQPTEGGDNAKKPLLDQLQITARTELPAKNIPDIFVSYAWGDDSSEDARKRTEIVDRLCETLEQDGWNILRDKTDMRSGDLISGFIKRIGLADHVIVVLSDKYLRSTYCMTELHYIYQRSLGEKEDFLRWIIPMRLADARFGTWRDRVAFAEYWEAEFKAMEEKFRQLGTADFALYRSMQEWHNRIGDMLAYVNDVLTPHGFDEIVKDDFAALRQMLERHRS